MLSSFTSIILRGIELDKLKLVQNVLCWDFPLHWELVHIREFMRPMDIFVDVGAHVGSWCLNLASYCKHVIAFEPDAAIFAALSENIKLNNINNIHQFQIAVSNHTGGEMLTVMESGHSTLFQQHPLREVDGNATDAFIKGRVPVNAVMLDDFLFPMKGNVDLIKIDVEGNEVKVLQGALETIERCKPSLFVEYHGGANRDAVRALLPALNFKDAIINKDIGYLIYRRD